MVDIASIKENQALLELWVVTAFIFTCFVVTRYQVWKEDYLFCQSLILGKPSSQEHCKSQTDGFDNLLRFLPVL